MRRSRFAGSSQGEPSGFSKQVITCSMFFHGETIALKPRLFGSSGIRGLAVTEISTTLSMRVGAALAAMHPNGSAVVGRDARNTGPMLMDALVAGYLSGGVDCLRVGLVPTPVTAWMVTQAGAETGVEISASHNPPMYNGLKVFNSQGMSFTRKEQLALENILVEEAYKPAPWDGVGVVEEADPVPPYIEAVLDAVDVDTGVKVACDLFNGATCTLAPQIFPEFGLDAEFLNAVPDGFFPAGNPEPTSESLKRLGCYVRSRGLDLGFGFDGDGDRMMPVDAEGVMVSPDRLLAAYAGYAVELNGGGVVVTHVGASMNVDTMVRDAGGEVVRTPVGDAFITEAMAEQDAVFGGEPVGAWVHPDVHMCPDGVLAALKLLEALQETGLNLREFVEQAPTYPLSRSKLDCPNRLKHEALKRIGESYMNTFRDVESVSKVDGVRLKMEDGWVLIRPSGTEPIIRVTVEGRTVEAVEEYMNKGRRLVTCKVSELH